MKRWISLLALFAILATFAGCGGSSSDPIIPTPTTLSGTAAAGAPIIGQVTVKGSLGNTKTAQIEANGNYTVDVTGLTAPYRLRALGTVGGVQYQLHSYAEAADLGGTVNITPFTDLIVANAAGQLASAYFDSAAPAAISPAALAAQEEALQTKLQEVFTALGVEAAVDLLRTSFSADHTALDAALDIIRIETDTTTNVATITNVIDNTSITDSILSTTDTTPPLVVNPGLDTAVAARQAIFNRFDAFSALFATSLPSPAALDALLSSDFLMNDNGKAQILTEWTTDPEMIGLTFSSVVIKSFDDTAGTATVAFNVAFNGVVDSGIETMTLVKTNGTWQLRGNQEIVDRWFDYICATSSYGEGCGINLGVDDLDQTNNLGAGIISSAKVTLMRAGNPVTGGIVYMGTPTNGAAGELRIYDTDYNNDYMAFGTGAFEFDPTLFQVGDELQYELFDTALDLSNTAVPAVTGTPVATYFTPVSTTPVTVANSPSYPSATPATLTAFNAYTTDGGSLTVGWTLPTGQNIQEVMFQVCDYSTCADLWEWRPTGSSVTLNIDTSSLNLADAPYRTELRVYSANAQGQTYLHQYYGTADLPNVPPTSTPFTAAMLDANPTYYITYPGNDTTNLGTTQETLVVSGTNPYTVNATADYFDATDSFVSTSSFSGTFTLNSDGTLTGGILNDPNPTTFTLNAIEINYLDVTGVDNSGTWSDFWYLVKPVGWLASTPVDVTVESSFIQSRNYENGTTPNTAAYITYSIPSLVTQVEMLDSNSASYGLGTQYTDQSYMYNCLTAPCTDVGSFTDSYYFFTGPGQLPADTYTFVATLTDSSTLPYSITTATEVLVPYVSSTTMQSTWEQNGDLTLSWSLPDTDPSWPLVNQLRIWVFGSSNLHVKVDPTQTSVTIPSTVLAASGVTSANTWRVETRAYDTNNMNNARGRSLNIPLSTGGPTTQVFTAQMLNASPTYYITYPGNDTSNLGTTQETFVISGTGPSYTVNVTSDYFDETDSFVSTSSFSGTFILNSDGSVTGGVPNDPNPATFTINAITTDYLDVAGADNTGTWNDFWYLVKPAGWLSSTGGPANYAVVYQMLRNNNYEANADYSTWIQITKDSQPLSAADFATMSVTNNAGAAVTTLSTPAVSTDTYIAANCTAVPCTFGSPTTESGVYVRFSTLPLDTYTFTIDMTDGGQITPVIDFAEDVSLPVVLSSSMLATPDTVTGDLALSWTNPTTDTNWSSVTQLRIAVQDTTGNTVGYVRADTSQEMITLPANLVQAMKNAGDGTLASWRVQTRAYNTAATTNPQFARGYSNPVALPVL